MATPERQSILCPNCKKLINSDEPRCPYCGIASPGSWWKNTVWKGGLFGADQIISTIIVANVAMYLISLLIDPQALKSSLNLFTLLSPTNKSLLLLGATGTIPIDQLHRWWSLLSANYLHGSMLHILFNMLAFRYMARLIVKEYGVYRTVIIYTLGGPAGLFISYLAGVAFTIGASAAVCSLIGAALYYGKSRGGSYGQAIYRQIGGWAVGIFVFGLLVPGINNWGHAGGMGVGAVLALLLGYEERVRERLLHKVFAAGCVFLTGTILVWVVLSTLYQQMLG
jgi:rhomboid protease GluP